MHIPQIDNHLTPRNSQRSCQLNMTKAGVLFEGNSATTTSGETMAFLPRAAGVAGIRRMAMGMLLSLSVSVLGFSACSGSNPPGGEQGGSESGSTGGASQGGSNASDGGQGTGGGASQGGGQSTGGNGGSAEGGSSAGGSSGNAGADSDDFTGSTGPSNAPGEVKSAITMKDVRAGAHANYDRVVFEFAGDAHTGYSVEYAAKPVVSCGSGEPVKVAGNATLLVSFSPAMAHTEEGKPSIPAVGQSPGFKAVKELRQVCDFEGKVSWAVGVETQAPFRIVTLGSPTRVALDVHY